MPFWIYERDFVKLVLSDKYDVVMCLRIKFLGSIGWLSGIPTCMETARI
jgi:hypothetical protein